MQEIAGEEMNIALDVSPLADRNRTGIGNYIFNLITYLACLDEKNKYFLCYRFSRLKKRSFFVAINRNNFKTKIIQEPFNFIFQLKTDIFHGLADRLPWSYSGKKVVTIHDIGSIILRENYSSENFKRIARKRYENILNKRGADMVIAVSEFTKKEIVKHFCCPDKNIRVVYNGISPIFTPQDEEKSIKIRKIYNLEKDYFLYVGALIMRKNIPRILEAYKIFCEKNKNIDLVLAGHLSYGKDEILKEIIKFKYKDRLKIIGQVENNDLPPLYSGAKALIFPSLYEGFGLPVIEAMACGLPVLTSNRASLPEITGDAACLVNPEDISEIAQNMFMLAEDEKIRRDLRVKGLKRASLFSWEKTAGETLAVYKELNCR